MPYDPDPDLGPARGVALAVLAGVVIWWLAFYLFAVWWVG
jgi:hypothetical protein